MRKCRWHVPASNKPIIDPKVLDMSIHSNFTRFWMGTIRGWNILFQSMLGSAAAAVCGYGRMNDEGDLPVSDPFHCFVLLPRKDTCKPDTPPPPPPETPPASFITRTPRASYFRPSSVIVKAENVYYAGKWILFHFHLGWSNLLISHSYTQSSYCTGLTVSPATVIIANLRAAAELLWAFFIHLKLELLTQFPASNEWKIILIMKNGRVQNCIFLMNWVCRPTTRYVTHFCGILFRLELVWKPIYIWSWQHKG